MDDKFLFPADLMGKLQLKTEKIEANEGKLTWQPWVGDYYFNQDQNGRPKTLIIGESHYMDYKDWKNVEATNKHFDPKFTRQVVSEIAIQRKLDDKRRARLFENFYLAFRDSENHTRGDFWHSLAFYNFIQTPMLNPDKRPTRYHFEHAWNVFPKVVEQLQAERVIFLGKSALDVYRKIRNEKFSGDNLIYYTDVGKNQKGAKTLPNLNINGAVQKINIYFIRHSSAFFEIKEWREYFNREGLLGN